MSVGTVFGRLGLPHMRQAVVGPWSGVCRAEEGLDDDFGVFIFQVSLFGLRSVGLVLYVAEES